MKKRLLALLLALAMVFALASCGDNAGSASGTAPEDGSSSSSTSSEVKTYATAEEALADAQACYDSMKDLSGEELLAEFQKQQAALNFDGNTSEFLIDPSTSLVDGFTDTVASVGENEIALSGETDYGYFVVLRLPLGEENLSTIKDEYINSLFSTHLNDAANAAEVVESDALANLDYDAYFEKLSELQDAIDTKYEELYDAYTAQEGNEDAESEEVARAVEADLLASLDAAVLADCTAYLTDGAMTADTVGLTVDGREVPVSAYLYFLCYYKSYYQNMYYYYYQSELDLTSNYTDDMTWMEFFKTLAKNYTVQYATAMNLAEQNGVEPSEETRQEMEDSIASAMESNMLYVGSSIEASKIVLEYGLYGDAYQESLYGENGSTPITEADAEEYAAENGYYNCRYILFRVVSEDAE